MRKHAVLIHGCHLQTDGWEHVVWGDPSAQQMGRIPKGVMFARAVNADLIFWGTGASERNGRKESERTFQAALNHQKQLSNLCGGDDHRDANENTFLTWLYGVSHIDLDTQNTDQEIGACAEMCLEKGVTQLTLVSSPFHIMRCHATALKIFASDTRFTQLRQGLVACASDTNPTGIDASDVVIIEPPHRGDTPKVAFHETAREIFKFLRNPEAAFAFNRAWRDLIREYTNQL